MASHSMSADLANAISREPAVTPGYRHPGTVRLLGESFAAYMQRKRDDVHRFAASVPLVFGSPTAPAGQRQREIVAPRGNLRLMTAEDREWMNEEIARQSRQMDEIARLRMEQATTSQQPATAANDDYIYQYIEPDVVDSSDLPELVSDEDLAACQGLPDYDSASEWDIVSQPGSLPVDSVPASIQGSGSGSLDDFDIISEPESLSLESIPSDNAGWDSDSDKSDDAASEPGSLPVESDPSTSEGSGSDHEDQESSIHSQPHALSVESVPHDNTGSDNASSTNGHEEDVVTIDTISARMVADVDATLARATWMLEQVQSSDGQAVDGLANLMTPLFEGNASDTDSLHLSSTANDNNVTEENRCDTDSQRLDTPRATTPTGEDGSFVYGLDFARMVACLVESDDGEESDCDTTSQYLASAGTPEQQQQQDSPIPVPARAESPTQQQQHQEEGSQQLVPTQFEHFAPTGAPRLAPAVLAWLEEPASQDHAQAELAAFYQQAARELEVLSVPQPTAELERCRIMSIRQLRKELLRAEAHCAGRASLVAAAENSTTGGAEREQHAQQQGSQTPFTAAAAAAPRASEEENVQKREDFMATIRAAAAAAKAASDTTQEGSFNTNIHTHISSGGSVAPSEAQQVLEQSTQKLTAAELDELEEQVLDHVGFLPGCSSSANTQSLGGAPSSSHTTNNQLHKEQEDKEQQEHSPAPARSPARRTPTAEEEQICSDFRAQVLARIAKGKAVASPSPSSSLRQ
ncbi:hypothetical protein Micbo1qcDRAFT_179537 [Microdochium bolleyi]|uniref:Uncharacterized protein n=1 Tax=Microdochium bolleyi TaxID=196109 RepID=A0A136IPR4_9PEZI|nr:hypothetical protein Micbo1qcDRAFT_179537 [Microdochium bolleyi]